MLQNVRPEVLEKLAQQRQNGPIHQAAQAELAQRLLGTMSQQTKDEIALESEAQE